IIIFLLLYGPIAFGVWCLWKAFRETDQLMPAFTHCGQLLDPGQLSGLARRSMTYLNAIAADRTVRLWWCGDPHAARWCD
ncbi:MAG: hypothetical protein ABIU10_03890, partial [Sphingomicrobium sp.]